MCRWRTKPRQNDAHPRHIRCSRRHRLPPCASTTIRKKPFLQWLPLIFALKWTAKHPDFARAGYISLRRRTRNRPAKVEKAPDTESGSHESECRAKQGMAGTAGVGGQRRCRKTQATVQAKAQIVVRPPETNRARKR